jgi:hypothetical protein
MGHELDSAEFIDGISISGQRLSSKKNKNHALIEN